MAYHPKKHGLEAYNLQKTRRNVLCFVCREEISAGTYRYCQKSLNMCVKCAEQWINVGGNLGQIPRARTYNGVPFAPTNK